MIERNRDTLMPQLIGLMLGLQAVQWMFMPATAAESLGMPLLEGVARSSRCSSSSDVSRTT